MFFSALAICVLVSACGTPLPQLGPVPEDQRTPGRYYMENFPASFEIGEEWTHHDANWWNRAHFDKELKFDDTSETLKLFVSAKVAPHEADLQDEYIRFNDRSDAMLDVDPDNLVAEGRGKRRVGPYRGLYVAYSEERGDTVISGEFVAFWADGVVYRFNLEAPQSVIEFVKSEFERILASFELHRLRK